MIYNVDFDIGAIFIWLFTIFCIFSKKGLKKTSNKIFLYIVLAGFISSVADTIGCYVNTYIYHNGYVIWDFFNYIFLGVHNLMPYLFVLYIIYLMGINHRMSRMTALLLNIPIVLSVLVLLLNPVLHWVYYYDADNMYTHDDMIYLLYFNAFLYLMIAIILTIKFRNALSKMKCYALLLFIIVSTLPIAVQMFLPTLLIELFFQAIGLLGILISIENEDEIINSITQIYNRYALLNDVTTAINTHTKTVIMTVKLPNTSYYNTTFGIQYMNEMLQKIALWLESEAYNANCYDCENGHFALMSYAGSKDEFKELAAVIMERFSLEWSNHNLQMIFPVQLCMIQIPEDINTIEQLMLMIDAPFENSGNKCELVELNVFGDYHREILIEKLITEAIEQRKFQVWYQPIWNRENNHIHSAEALIRLIDDELGFIPPDEFIPIAEKNGSIVEIGEFVFDEVCRFYKEQNLKKIGIDYIEVNLSVVQCMNKKLIETFDHILSKYDLDASCINLEITESAAASNQMALKDSVIGLNSRGFDFSLDDYGTGYSNFSYMFGMPFSIIKLDKSILWSAINPKNDEEDKNAMMFLESTMHMMQQMNYKIIVEGVETEKQKALLERLHCDYFQGFYFSKPVPANDFMDYIKNFNTK